MSTLIRMALVLAAILVVVLLAGRTSRAADDCITTPNAAPPQGNHWYYRIDRTTQRHCWYLRPESEKVGGRVHQSTAAAQPPSAQEPVSPPTAQPFDAALLETMTFEE